MLFLYRPRETWMPFRRPMSTTQQAAYNRRLQTQFESTRRVAPALPAPTARPAVAASAEPDPTSALEQLDALHDSGVLTDAEFTAAKTRVLER